MTRAGPQSEQRSRLPRSPYAASDYRTLHDRAADNWRPLFAIADLAGGNWPTLARQVAVRLSEGGAEQDASVRVQLLMDIKDFRR